MPKEKQKISDADSHNEGMEKYARLAYEDIFGSADPFVRRLIIDFIQNVQLQTLQSKSNLEYTSKKTPGYIRSASPEPLVTESEYQSTKSHLIDAGFSAGKKTDPDYKRSTAEKAIQFIESELKEMSVEGTGKYIKQVREEMRSSAEAQR